MHAAKTSYDYHATLHSLRVWFIVCAFAAGIACFAVLPSSAYAATYTWDGGGGDANWDTPANWSSDTKPGSSDTAYFDGTCVTNCSPSVTSNISVSGLTMAAGYTGTITVATSSPIIGNSGFSQASGTFQGGTGTVTYYGAFTISGGTYNAASSTNFTVVSNFVNGAINVATTQTFHSIFFGYYAAGGGEMSIASGDTLVALGTTTFDRGNINSTATIDARGNIVTNVNAAQTSALIVDFGNDSLAQTWTVNGGTSPIVRFDSAADANDSIVLTTNSTFLGATTTSSFSGTIPFPQTGYTLSFGGSGYLQAAGTFQGSTSTVNIGGSFTLSGGAYNAASTTNISIATNFVSAVVDVPTTATFYSLSFGYYAGGGSLSVATGDTLVVLGTTTFAYGAVGGSATIQAYGNVVVNSSASQASSLVVDFANDSVSQTWTAQGGTGPIVRLDSAADANDSIILTANSTFYGASTTASFSGVMPFVQSGYTYTFGAGGWYQAAGTFQGGTSTVAYGGSFTLTGGTYNAASTTSFAVGTNFISAVIDVPTSQTFHSLSLGYYAGGGSLSIASGDTLIALGTTTFAYGSFTGGAVEARGNVVVSSSFSGNSTPTLALTGSSTSGSANQTLDLSSATGNFNADITINKAQGKVSLASALVMDASSQDLTVASGTLDINGYNLTVSGSGSTFIMSGLATLALQGGETVTAPTTMGASTTVEYNGSGTYTSLRAGTTYANLAFSGTGTWSTSTSLTIGGNFSQTAGIFTQSAGTTTFIGVTPVITSTSTATTTFNHVDISTTGGATPPQAYWKFDAGSGSSAVDSSGNGYTGTLTNMEAGDWYTSDKPTLSFTNDASIGTNASDEYISVSPVVDIGSSWTIATWFKWPLATGNSGGWNTLTRASGGAGAHEVIVRQSDNALGTYVSGFYSSGYDMDVLSNGWHHLAAVASSSGTSFFIDGTFVGTAGAKSTDDVTYIGNYQGGGQQWGQFDDLRIFSTALSTSEIAQLGSSSGYPSTATTTLVGSLSLSGSLAIAASNTLDVSTSSCNGSSCGVSVGGNFTNSGTYLARSGTTTFNGTGQQVATGTLTGASSFTNLRISNTSQNGSSTSSIVFGAPITVSDTFTMAASSSAAFLANATSTFENISLEGTSSSPVYLRSTTDGTPWGFAVAGEQKRVTYVNVRNSNACSGNPEISAVDGTSVDAGGNTCWDFPTPGVANIISAANQTFTLNSGTSAISAITVVENPDAPSITAANNLRITIASSTTSIRFDTTDTSAVFGGTASAKVSNPVSYEGDGSVAVIDVTSDFAAGNTLTISGLSFVNFATITAPTVILGIRAGGPTDQTDDDTDTKTVAVKGALVLADHTAGQVDDNFVFPNEHDVLLFAFSLAPSGEYATTTAVSFTLSDIVGMTSADIGNALLYRDFDGDAVVDATDEAVGGAGSVSITSTTGTLSLTGDFLSTTTLDYLLAASVANIRPGDAMTISLDAGSVSAEGASSTVAITPTGSVNPIRHFRTGGGAGGEIGDAAPASGGIRGGGGGGAGQDINPNSGDTIGNNPGFETPGSTGSSHNEWTNGSSAYGSDGAYATAASTNLRQSYASFGFNIPGNATIDGIEVRLEGYGSTAAGTIEVALSWDGDASVTTAKTTTTLTTTDAIYTLGGATDTWGRSWTPTELNNTNFRLRLIAQPSGNTIGIDALRVKVHQHVSGGGGGGGSEI